MSDVGRAHLDRLYHLLVVDDDGTDRRNYGRLLGRKAPGAFELAQAGDGAAGLAALRTKHFDCILLDFYLPDMNGFEFLADAAVDGEMCCAVVLVTGQGNEAIAVEAMKRGVQDYLVKDQINENSLWRAVTRAVTQKELGLRLANSLRDLSALNTALENEAAIREAADVELRAAKEAAEQANLAKTRFVAMVTHELRTPLNGIIGYAQLLRMEGELSSLQDKRVGAMMQAGQHLLGMIEQVLDFACIESGRIALRPAVVSVRDLSERCIAFIEPMAAQHALSVRLCIAADAPQQIVADPSRLRQILLNLLGNAVKYTDVGGVELRLLAGTARGGLRVEVADTGRGITDCNIDCLFQDFERLGAATSVEGAGLGLAIAARIVRLMGGEIGHTSNPGGGSVFWLDLPTAHLGSQSLLDHAQEAPLASGKRVLLVDDIAMNRDVISAFLCVGGHAVVLAEGGQEAVRLASEQVFDVVLMDVRMPVIDGLEATRRIRALPPPHGRIPILALTAYAFPEQVAQCRSAGMDGHVAKPVDYAVLMRAISDVIARTPPKWAEDCSPPAPPGAKAEEKSLPRLDRTVLDQTLAFIPPGEVGANLKALRARKKQMLALLDQSAAPALLAETAHALASTAGMFGFVALSAASRNFERAAANEAPEASGLAQHVRAEARAALGALDEFMREIRLPTARAAAPADMRGHGEMHPT